MIKKMLYSASFVVFAVSAFAQQPANTGYETWVNQGFPLSYDEPASWATTNSLRAAEAQACTCIPSDPVSIFKAGSANAFAGTDAMKIVSSVFPYVPAPVSSFINDTSGFAWIGSVQATAPYIFNGYGMTTRYAAYTFNAKYTPTGNDSAFCFVAFVKRNGANRDTVAYGYQYIHSQATYKSYIITLTYKMAIAPDTAIIIASATNPTQPKVGSTLYVDGGTFSGIQSINNETSKLTNWIHASPNPANNVITFTSPANDLSLMEIYDVAGRSVDAQVTSTNKTVFDVSVLSTGLYTYRAYNDKKQVIGVGKFNVAR